MVTSMIGLCYELVPVHRNITTSFSTVCRTLLSELVT